MHILLIEDDDLLADGLSRSLKQAGYVVEVASDGRSAENWLASASFDLVVLDLGLPDLDGSVIVQRLRERGRDRNLPVLVLSARMELEERVRLLDLGADDYLVKPVAAVELIARVRALVRRAQSMVEVYFSLGRLRLDSIGKRAWIDERVIELSAREWAAVEFFATRVNRIVSKEQITQALYGWDEEITPNAIEKIVSRLRAKLEPAGITIRTVRGLGYFLEQPGDATT